MNLQTMAQIFCILTDFHRVIRVSMSDLHCGMEISARAMLTQKTSTTKQFATVLEPRTTQFENEHLTIYPNWPND